MGNVVNLARLPGVAQHGLPIKTIGDALQIRNRALEMLEGAEKPEPPVFHQPADRVAVPPAPEAMRVTIGIEPERGRPLRMKGAERDKIRARAFQGNIRANDIDDVIGGAYLVERCFGN